MKKRMWGTASILAVLLFSFVSFSGFMDFHSFAAASSAGASPQPSISAGADNSSGRAETQQSDFSQQVKAWVQELAKQDQFAAWKDASWQRYALGPGTHGWIVILQKEAQQIGYMIVYATPDDRYILNEYGLGKSPLFNPSFAETQHQEVHRLYYGPLHAVWAAGSGKSTAYYDAKSGEQLPLTEQDLQSRKPYRPSKQEPTVQLLKEHVQNKWFDPYDYVNWIANTPADFPTFRELRQALIQEQKVTYAANLFNNKILAPFAVTGYHVWDQDIAFVELEDDGARYIRFSQLSRIGSFYQ